MEFFWKTGPLCSPVTVNWPYRDSSFENPSPCVPRRCKAPNVLKRTQAYSSVIKRPQAYSSVFIRPHAPSNFYDCFDLNAFEKSIKTVINLKGRLKRQKAFGRKRHDYGKKSYIHSISQINVDYCEITFWKTQLKGHLYSRESDFIHNTVQ